ncbi:GNAT family N-acetyltransferase [Alicyclobacillus acidoterrestris]|uniref:GNAT family N-acetyltransferase n=1 Tax=Alicyclobacillus acidoterrestris (strain ATCC 49025 / DSM 3922 / CIP 106132 / NCIMB 13137 / GD3B) TaxID=1356854 RepID=T0CS04_ALIAG|nr:GNAT family N-acetyltransferase [Alicyclobacillus acidoterrestris]EPZ42232.1 hypothetical protein N007_15550 [Alicyclobacillus acidoterrestris ATCC 49025]UNO47849.1 GNAT family N-acetyltransferase [Alicyclobacillus acidoterrestris]
MITFRFATVSDTNLIHEITQDAWEAYKNIPGSSSALNETPEQIRTMLATNDSTAVLGYADSEPVLSVRLHLEDNYLLFSRLGVRKAHQGRGYARMALAWLDEYAKLNHINEIRCTVRASIRRNVQLYESVGYRRISEELLEKENGVTLMVWTMTKNM